MDSVLIPLRSDLVVLLFLDASSDLVAVAAVGNPRDYSTRSPLHPLGFVDRHIEIQRSSENIKVAPQRAVGLWDLVAARPGKAALFRCSKLVRLGIDGCHPLCRRRSQRGPGGGKAVAEVGVR